MKRVKLLITAGIILVSVILTVAGWIILPDSLVLQITMSGGAGTTLPKLAGLAIPFSISVIFAVLYYMNENKKHLLYSILGLAIFLPTFLMN